MRQAPGSIRALLITLGGVLLAAAASHIAPISRTAASVASLSKHSPAQELRGEITKANWRQHPEIKSIRALVQSVTAAMRRKSLTVRKRAFEYCEPYQDAERTIARDSAGRTRYYRNQGGSEDSSLTWEHYYDAAGHPRFILITGGAVNGTKLEHRIYFDEAGERIWEEQTYRKGPGYTFPEKWPADQLQLINPLEKFLSASACAEVKQKAGKQKRSGR